MTSLIHVNSCLNITQNLSMKKHHAVIVAAMKAKQNVDEKVVLALQKCIEDLAPYYPEHKH